MSFEHYIRSGQKLLRCGYTTGTCAALAAAGAAELLLGGSAAQSLRIVTPKGLTVELVPARLELEADGQRAVCAVIKDGGDDADVTTGLPVTAAVEKAPGGGIRIDGGAGVGRVTKAGLDQPIGAAAINRVPRRMIEEEVRKVCDRLGYDGGLSVLITVPGGEEIARRTFNPMLGIEGGISILGTSGIVEPMSEQAIVDTIAVEQKQAAAAGAKGLILTPGNYGMDWLRAQGLDGWGVPVVKCSNFIGDSLDIAATLGFERVLLVGHAGKLVKLAGGIMNTHSRYADCRVELLCAHAAVCGAGAEVCAQLMQAATTDACLEILEKAGLRTAVTDRVLAAVDSHITHRAAGAFAVGAVLFSNVYGLLGQTETAKEILRQWKTN